MNLERIYKKARRHGDVHSALVVAVATTANEPIIVTTNRRGGGRVSKWTTHAEERIAKKVAYYKRMGLVDIHITVMRFRKDGTLGMAKPCSGCEALLNASEVDHVYYTDSYGKICKLF